MSKSENEKASVVEPGMYVEYAYRLYDENGGALLFEATREHPDMMVCGASTEVVPGLVQAMEGLKAGDRFETILPPEAAFGARREDDVIELEKDIFMRDGELAEEVKPGAVLPMMTAEGYRVIGTVLEIGDKKIRMDFNHPFAGMTVRYDGEIIKVREATPDEIHPAGGCGGCHGGCGGGGCDNGGCDSGCCGN